jgi:hypothetical protein
MKENTRWRDPVRLTEDRWFYVGRTFWFVDWKLDETTGRKVVRSFKVPVKALRSGLAIYDAHRVAQKRHREAKKAAK